MPQKPTVFPGKYITGLSQLGWKFATAATMPQCVNPEHLFVGTQADNIKDRDAKGRMPPPIGSRNGNAKLDAPTVLRIREQVLAGRRHEDVAELFGVSPATVSNVAKGKGWRPVSRSRTPPDLN